ncbi:unnamed protein product [Staurois parvus]|uniref:Uncharacterized protein n=1 Tax=Staurois parvus TaxID=386267 RepID=A0ABN9D8Q0_9NEOB|nr:unnamed protein product [Staurois parvus]
MSFSLAPLEPIVDLNSWVSTHIKKKECVAFIPQKSSDGETCGCGYTRESHFHDTSNPNRPPEINWDPQKTVEEFPSDAHGDMTFTGTTRTWAKYVRASSDTHPSILFELMTEQWGASCTKSPHICDRRSQKFQHQSKAEDPVQPGPCEGCTKHRGLDHPL